LESFYQTDLSSLRVHTGDIAQRSAKDLGADAYTVGTDIVLGAGAAGNDRIMAHETKHAIENMSGVVEKGTNRGDGMVVTNPRQESEVTAEQHGDAFVSGVEFAPSLTAQRAVSAGGAVSKPVAQRAITIQRGNSSSTEKSKKEKKKKKDSGHTSAPHSPNHSLHDGATGPVIGYASSLPANPWLYFDYSTDPMSYWVGPGGGPEDLYQYEQFCAYMSVYWLNHGHSDNGLRFAEFSTSRRMDAVNTLIQWTATGRDGQTRYACERLGGHEYSYQQLTQAVNGEQLRHGSKIWFGNDVHAEAAYVRKDKKGKYIFDMYDPNTGIVTACSAKEFLAYTKSKNAFVVKY
jgi:hypothetical protein